MIGSVFALVLNRLLVGAAGIGAYEARELVRAMGGTLTVESREGLGSRFSIRVPLAEAAELRDNFAAKVA